MKTMTRDEAIQFLTESAEQLRSRSASSKEARPDLDERIARLDRGVELLKRFPTARPAMHGFEIRTPEGPRTDCIRVRCEARDCIAWATDEVIVTEQGFRGTILRESPRRVFLCEKHATESKA